MISGKKYSYPVLTGDTLVTMGGPKEGQKISFMTLPSKAKGLPEKNWSVALPFKGRSVAIHPPMNVVAVSEYIKSISDFRIHILGMDTGKKHTLALVSPFPQDLRGNFSKIHPPCISINQTFVAVLLKKTGAEHTNADELVVWNWRKGLIIYSEMNTSYDTITLVSDTWLVAGHRVRRPTDPPSQEFSLDLLDISAKDNPKTRLGLSVSQLYKPGGHFAGLHSGEPAFYDPFASEFGSTQGPHSPSSSEVIIMAQIQNYSSETMEPVKEPSAYCVALRLGQLLGFADQCGYIPWDEWKGYTFTSEKVFDKYPYSNFCVSGCSLVDPLELGTNKLTAQICEFDPRGGLHISPSYGDSPADTHSTSLVDINTEAKNRAEEGGGVMSTLPPPRGAIVEFTPEAEDLTGFWTNVTIVEDNLIVVSWDPIGEVWSILASLPLTDFLTKCAAPFENS